MIGEAGDHLAFSQKFLEMFGVLDQTEDVVIGTTSNYGLRFDDGVLAIASFTIALPGIDQVTYVAESETFMLS